MGWVTKECIWTAKVVHYDSAHVGDIRQLQQHRAQSNMNASTKALGAVLLQKRTTEASFHPVAYFSRKLNNL